MTELYDDEGQTPEQVKKQQMREERDADDIRFVMGSEKGRRVVWQMLEKGSVFSTTFSMDPHATAFNEGQRNLALALFQRVMSVCPELYLKMADEAAKQE
ncbi:hypothetical protein AAAW50_003050 [Cronobacter sakazakii]